LLFGIILGVITFWLFAHSTLNIAPDVKACWDGPARQRADQQRGLPLRTGSQP
jgi:hypothetical protein